MFRQQVASSPLHPRLWSLRLISTTKKISQREMKVEQKRDGEACGARFLKILQPLIATRHEGRYVAMDTYFDRGTNAKSGLESLRMPWWKKWRRRGRRLVQLSRSSSPSCNSVEKTATMSEDWRSPTKVSPWIFRSLQTRSSDILSISAIVLEQVPDDKDAFQCKVASLLQLGEFNDALKTMDANAKLSG